MRRRGLYLGFMVACGLAVACESSGNDSGAGGAAGTGGTAGTPGPATPLSLSEQTAIPATSAVANVSTFFSAFGELVSTAVGSLTGVAFAGSEVSAKVDVPIGDLCSSGTATADWTDADGDQQLSEGDTVMITLSNCVFGTGAADAASGTASIEITDVNDGRTLFQANTTLDLTVGESTVSGQDFQTTIDLARFGQIILRIGDSLDTDLIEVTGDFTLRLGCFDIEPVYDIGQGAPLLLRIAISAVASVDGDVISIDDFASSFTGNNINFDSLGLPSSGGIPIFSGNQRGMADDLGPCPSFGDPGDSSTVSPTFSSEMADPRTDACADLAGQDSNGTPFEVATSWLKLLDGDFTPGAPTGCGSGGMGGNSGTGGTGGSGTESCGGNIECTPQAPTACGTACQEICGGFDNFDSAGCGADNRCFCTCIAGPCPR